MTAFLHMNGTPHAALDRKEFVYQLQNKMIGTTDSVVSSQGGIWPLRQRGARSLRGFTLLRFSLLWVLGLLAVLPSTGSGQTIDFDSENGEYPVGLSPIAVAVADFNGDGAQDLAVANYDSDDVSIFLGTGTGEFLDLGFTFPVAAGPFEIKAVDVNGDGRPDLVSSAENDDLVSVLLNEGDGFFAEVQNFDCQGAAPEGLVVADFTGDGRPDIAVVNNFDETVSILRGVGDGTFVFLNQVVTGAAPMGLGVGDLDGDGNLDLVAANTAGGDDANGSLSILKGRGDGSFLLEPEFLLPEICGDVGCLPVAVAVQDFDRDGRADMVVVNQDGDSLGVFLGNGDMTFKEPTVHVVSSTPAGVVVADFNRDGHLDVASTGSFDNFVSVLLGTGTGTFGTPYDFLVGESPTGIATGEFNGDLLPDIVVGNVDDETITVLLSVDVDPRCAGDCDENQEIDTVDLLNMVDLALSGSAAVTCANGDADGNGGITVEEIVGAVRKAGAGGCDL